MTVLLFPVENGLQKMAPCPQRNGSLACSVSRHSSFFTGHGHATLRHLAWTNPMAEGHTPACHQQVEAHLFKAKRILHFEVCYGMTGVIPPAWIGTLIQNTRGKSSGLCIERGRIKTKRMDNWVPKGWKLRANSFQAAAFPCQPSAQNTTNDLMTHGNRECM